MGSNSIFAKLWEYDKHNQYFQPFIQIPTCSSQTTTKQITPHQKSSMNLCIFSSLSCFIACMQGCHSIHQMANLIKLLSQEQSDFLKLLPISRENLRKTDPCLGSFASQSDPSERHTGTMIDRSAPRGRIVPNANYSRTLT